MAEASRGIALNDSLTPTEQRDISAGVGEASSIVVSWAMTNATSANDLAETEVRVFAADGATILPTVLTPTTIHASVLSGNVASVIERFDVRGLDRVSIRVQNDAAADRDTIIQVNHVIE